MSNSPAEHKAPRRIQFAGLWIGGALGILAWVCVVSYLLDCAKLERTARYITAGDTGNSEKVVKLLSWVHKIDGTSENEQYFVLRRLRATPLQVVAAGGDCADKSRLLSAMLREVGIPATMLVCYHRASRVPTHTVVEARIGADQYMVVDPAYGLAFPKGDSGEYYGLLELRANPAIVDDRIQSLAATEPRTSPIHAYNPISAAYDHATTINWNKNAFTRIAGGLAMLWIGDAIHRLPRPILLEEPKLHIGAMLAAFGGFVVVGSHILAVWLRRRPLPVVLSGATVCGR